MPTPPVTGRSRGKCKILIEISSDEEGGGGGAARKGAVIAGGGEGQKRIKPEPGDDVGINAEFRGVRGRALEVIPQRSENPQPPPPVAAARPSGRPLPEVIDISSFDDDEDEEEYRRFRAGSPPRKVLLIKGGGHGERHVKKEPSDGSGSRARSPAGTRSKVGDPAPGSSIAKRKRKRQSPDRARPCECGGHRDGRARSDSRGGHHRDGRARSDSRGGHRDGRARSDSRGGHHNGRVRPGVRGGHGATSWNSGASGTGRRMTGISHEARTSRERNNGKNREESRGSEVDRPHLAKEALVFSEKSWGAPGKANRGERSSGMPLVDGVGATVGSRIRSRARQRRMQDASHSVVQQVSHSVRVVSDNSDEDGDKEEQQGRVQHSLHSAREVSYDSGEQEEKERPEQRASHSSRVGKGRVQHASQHSAHVVSDDSNGDAEEEEEQEEQGREEWGEEVAMDSNGEGSEGNNGVAHEGEQEEYVVGENIGEEDQAAHDPPDVVWEQQEREGHNQLEEDEGGSEEDSHSIYKGGEEDGEEDSEADQEEFDGAGEAQSCAPSNGIAAGSARSGGGSTRTFRKRMFEGICLLDKPDKTTGEGIERRTRSKRKCSNRKLLTRGVFSKPIKIDVPESTSESEEDIPPPVPTCQGLLSSSEDYSHEARWNSSRRKNGKREKKESASSDEYEVKIRKYRRLKKGPSNGQAAKEGGKAYDVSNPDRRRYSGPHGEGPMNDAQDDLSFKKHANLAKMRKHQASRAKAAYEELLNSMFAEWENYTKASVPADEQGGNTLPLTFSFEDQDEEDKSDRDKFQEELWREFDIALESINIGSHGCEEDDTCNRQKVPLGEATSCENGKHVFIIDEQIGVRCKHCNVVDLEIRYVLPSMGKFAAERDSTSPELDLFKEMLTLFEKNDLIVSNAYEGAFRNGAGKSGSVWDLIPGVKEDMFLHQQDAFEFVWRKLAGSTEIEDLRRTVNTDIGGGCVISHAPGTGKTRLAITFVQSYLEVFPQCCPVIVAPRAMLATWEQEFKKWKVKLPFHVLNSTEINYSDDKTIQAKIDKDGSFARRLWANKVDQNYRRLVKLTSWVNGTSIIGVSYSLFRKLANDDGMDGDNVRKILLERPDLLVLDEGHTPRNKRSLIWKVLAQVRTEKRIILSGTLFQNNFEELYNTLYLVRPKDAMLLEKDVGKDWTSLRLSNITEKNIDKVREKLEPIVHHHKGNFLEKSLPGLKETVVILNPLPRQKEIVASMEKTVAMGTLDAEYKFSLALVHPSLITCAKLSEKEACLVDHTLLESLRSNPCEGVKTRFVVEVVHHCQVLSERVLVFSQYLEPLSLIMDQLKKRFNWTEDKEILQMSGNVRVKQREAMMAAFNNMKSDAKVMLASTKACCEGITLIGASRVVLLDVVWNPSVGRQAIGRAYRFGQKKIVYTYNLIADGTKEMEKYSRQAKKEHMSKMLFSNEKQPEVDNISSESTFDDRVLEAMTAREDLKNLFVQIRIENQTDGSIRDAGETEQKNVNPII